MHDIQNYPITEVLNEVPSYNINIGSNVYYNTNHASVPRVTQILSETLDSTALIRWANRIGLRREKYDEVLDKAANIGTEAHGLIENYIKNQIDDEYSNNIPFKGFLMWYKGLCKGNTVKPLYSEYSMSNQFFGGTLDLLLQINDRIYLVDFKTSNYVSEKYFLQLAAYRWLIYQNLNINIDGCIVLQLSKYAPGYNEYVLDFHNSDDYQFIEECHRAYLALVYAYYNAHYIKERYYELFERKEEAG